MCLQHIERNAYNIKDKYEQLKITQLNRRLFRVRVRIYLGICVFGTKKCICGRARIYVQRVSFCFGGCCDRCDDSCKYAYR